MIKPSEKQGRTLTVTKKLGTQNFWAVVVSVLLGLLTIGGFLSGRLEQGGLHWLLLVSLLAYPIILSGGGILRVVSKVGDQELGFELRQIQKDVYAKADAVNRLALGVARVIAFGLSRSQRIAGPNLDHLLLRERNRLSATLRDADAEIGEKEIGEAVSPLTSIIELDLASQVSIDTAHALRGGDMSRSQAKESEASKHVEKALLKSRAGQEVESVRVYLESLGVWTDKIQAGVQELQYFRETGKLHPLPEGQEDDE